MGQFFIAKITNIRWKLDGIVPSHPPLSTPEPNLESESGDIVFSDFQCQTTERVRHMITSGKKKSCILDPIPASLLSACLDSLFPAITYVVNQSLQTAWIFCWHLENCCGIPIIKKARPQSTVQEFRPISKLQCASKLTELVMPLRFSVTWLKIISSLNCNLLIAPITVLKITNDLHMNMYKGHVSLFYTTAGLECRLRHCWFCYNRLKQN